MKRNEYPLFWMLKPEAQAKLMQLYWDEFGTRLEIPAPPGMDAETWQTIRLESLEEIDRIIRQPPKHQKRGNW